MVSVVFGGTVYAASPADVIVLSVGIPPQQSSTELTKRWTPVLQYLTEKSGVNLELKTAKDIATFQHQILDGLYDIAFVNPNTYTAAHKTRGYTAFAREKDGRSFGIIVVRKEGPITEISQINGNTMAFPSPFAVMAAILPLKQLEQQKVTVKPQYVVSMDSVYRSVAKGLFVAGGGESRTFGTLDPEIQDQLTVLWRSDELPPFPFFAHPRVPAGTIKKLQQSMIAMSRDAEGLALLKTVNIKSLEKASDADYDVVRKMNLPLEVK